MIFSHKPGKPIEGELSYADHDKGLDFTPRKEQDMPGNHSASAALVASKTLQIEFRLEDGQLLYVWGYLPRESWEQIDAELELANATTGSVFVKEVDEPPAAGMGYETNLEGASARFFGGSGHLVIGEPSDADVLVEIATNTIIGLRRDQLCCVVLRPAIK